MVVPIEDEVKLERWNIYLYIYTCFNDSYRGTFFCGMLLNCIIIVVKTLKNPNE